MHEDQYNRFVKRAKEIMPKTISEHNPSKQDEIIRMAREAGFTDHEAFEGFECSSEELERFFSLAFAAGAAQERNRHAWTQEHWTEYEHAIAASERELCAKVCELIGQGGIGDIGDDTTALCAAAIRARGEK